MKKRDILTPLRWLYHWLLDRQAECLEKKRRCHLWKSVTFPLGKKAFVIGTPLHENMGDSAIFIAQKRFLNRCGWEEKRIIEITYDDYERDRLLYNKWIPKDALIAQLGGGHLGNQWLNEEMLHRQQTTVFCSNPTVIFPQTIYYTPDDAGEREAKASIDVYNGRENLTMVAREARSYEIMQSFYPRTRILLTPDIVLSATMESFGAVPQKREGVLLCLRSDPEKVLTRSDHDQIKALLEARGLDYRFSDTYCPAGLTKDNREERLREKLEELAGARLIITDRLHGMVFAALTGTPCIVFSNCNQKVRGTYAWISYLPYIRFAESAADVGKHLPELLAMENCKFDNTPLQPHFEKLAEVVRKYAPN